MKKDNKREAELQSRMGHMEDAKNAGNGFKSTMSSGTMGAGDALRHKK
ncbi:hypothetical protein [Sporanaerobium hydrogeniformans]|nr:hypothetical protein [Sporanaerobium hydrogeniformans]